MRPQSSVAYQTRQQPSVARYARSLGLARYARSHGWRRLNGFVRPRRARRYRLVFSRRVRGILGLGASSPSPSRARFKIVPSFAVRGPSPFRLGAVGLRRRVCSCRARSLWSSLAAARGRRFASGGRGPCASSRAALWSALGAARWPRSALAPLRSSVALLPAAPPLSRLRSSRPSRRCALWVLLRGARGRVAAASSRSPSRRPSFPSGGASGRSRCGHCSLGPPALRALGTSSVVAYNTHYSGASSLLYTWSLVVCCLAATMEKKPALGRCSVSGCFCCLGRSTPPSQLRPNAHTTPTQRPHNAQRRSKT